MSGNAHVAVYGEVNANLVDGSSVWLQSVCLTLARIRGVRVTLLLRAPIERDLLLTPLVEASAVRLVEPPAKGTGAMLSAEQAASALAEVDQSDRFDLLLLRGANVTEIAVGDGRFDGRLWLYHVPVAEESQGELRRWGRAAHRILCQTPEIEAAMLETAPDLAGRLLPLPPMIPPVGDPPGPPEGPVRRLLYAGKISPEYYFFEMVELLGRLRERLPGLELHVAGDKIHNPPADPAFREHAEQALRETDGLVWHEAVPREEIPALAAAADVALSIRHPSLNRSLEMSTKVLEYGAAGTPVLLNATPAHARALGEDYPLLANGVDDAARAVLKASADPELRAEAARRVHQLSRSHGFDRIAEGLAPHVLGARAAAPAGSGRRLLVAGHNLAFARPLLARARSGGAEIREDVWPGHTGGDTDDSAAALGWADVVLCEWCLGNAAWYSRQARDGKRLVVRFHRMELETDYPLEVALERVDSMVFVARHVLDQACERFGWPPDAPQLTVIENAIDCASLKRPKLPGAEFNLGLIGYVPKIKRLDRAIDVLERLRLDDERYRLIVKGRGPWEYAWMSSRPDERAYYEELFRRIDRSPLLRGAVRFDAFGSDIPEYLRQVGWIVSTSEIEGHSVALAEGASSAAIPVVLDRPGATRQYEERWVHETPDAAARAILALSAGGETEAESEAAAEFAHRWDWSEIWDRWNEVLDLNCDTARDGAR